MANAGFRQLKGERAQINGLDAYVGTYQGNLEGLGNVVTSRRTSFTSSNVYMLAGFAPPNQFQSAQRQFAASIRSFRELSREEAAGIRPNRVDVYTVRSGDTWQSIAQRTGDGTVKAVDAGDHEQLRADAAAARRRPHQDRRRRADESLV